MRGSLSGSQYLSKNAKYLQNTRRYRKQSTRKVPAPSRCVQTYQQRWRTRCRPRRHLQASIAHPIPANTCFASGCTPADNPQLLVGEWRLVETGICAAQRRSAKRQEISIILDSWSRVGHATSQCISSRAMPQTHETIVCVVMRAPAMNISPPNDWPHHFVNHRFGAIGQ